MWSTIHNAALRPPVVPAPRSPSAIRAACGPNADPDTCRARGASSAGETLDRRSALLGLGVTFGACAVPYEIAPVVFRASAEEMETFIGYATPPTSYGGYGGNADEPPKYTFEYPSGWKPKTVNKVEKGTQGIDSRVESPRGKGTECFVITLGRAGEDDKSFRLRDVDTTFQGFVGADYEMQDAMLASSALKRTERDVGGQQFYDYAIESPDTSYLSTVTVKEGKIFAFFIKAPTRTFKAKETLFKGMLSSFKVL